MFLPNEKVLDIVEGEPKVYSSEDLSKSILLIAVLELKFCHSQPVLVFRILDSVPTRGRLY